MSAELTDLTIAELGPLLAKREVSPVAVTEAYLKRIDDLDSRVHAFIRVTAERALADARAAEAEIANGEVRGPLHGVPIAVKDLFDTAGIHTTGHSAAYVDRVPTEDAFVMAKLRAAGTVLLGKLSMHELATGMPDQNGPFPPARNPWDLDRMPSGSSSGSGAALIARMCAGSLGSDTGGSIRGPAAWCAIVGLKPTYGLLSRRGVMPLSWTLDHAGPMTRTVEDTAIVLEAVAGYDPLDDGSANVDVPDYAAHVRDLPTGLKVGVPWSYIEQVQGMDPEVLTTFRAAVDDLGKLGVEIVPIEIPNIKQADTMATVILVSEAYAFHEKDLQTRPEKYGPGFRDRVTRGLFYSAADYVQATRARSRFRRGVAEVMTQVDLIATPTTIITAQRFDDGDYSAYDRASFTRLYNLTGQPAVSIPCGFSSSGLPIGLMLAARPFEDLTTLQLAHAYEQSHDWYARRPPL